MKTLNRWIKLGGAVASRQQISARGDPALAGEPVVRSNDVRLSRCDRQNLTRRENRSNPIDES